MSDGEKRILADWPAFSWNRLMQGAYARGIDEFVADNFAFRQSLTALAGHIKYWRGGMGHDLEIFNGKTMAGTRQQNASPVPTDHERPAEVPASPAESAESTLKTDIPTPSSPGTDKPSASAHGSAPPAMAVASAPGSDDAPYQNIESVIIYRGRAVQMFGATPGMVTPLAKTIARYHEEFPGLSIYFMAIPIGADFYLPDRITKGVMKEREIIEHLHSILPAQTRVVKAYERVGQQKSQYVYFKTDHHWTGLGAYYAYTAFAAEAGLEPLPLDAFARKEIPRFLGTLYHRTLSPTLAANPDNVEYFMVPVGTEVKYYYAGSSHERPGSLYAEYARGAMSYGVFLGGDYPLMKITSDIRNGKKIIVIKDSYGNAFVPYLSSHYETVYVIDYRYFNGSVSTLIKKEGVQELLFAHNTYVMSNSYTARRAREFLMSTPSVAMKRGDAGGSE